MNTEIEKLRADNAKLKEILRHVFPEKSKDFFICGNAGERDTLGLPDKILICPTYGLLDGFAVYQKIHEYSALGY